MDFLKIALIVFICVVLITCLPVYDKSISAMVSIAGCVVIIFNMLTIILPVIDRLKILFTDNTNYDLTIIFKCMGISMITRFVADIANDSGNKTLANRMILAGKIAIIALSMPLFSQVLEIIGKLIL